MIETTIKQLFEEKFNLNVVDMEINNPIDVSQYGYEVLSYDKDKKNVWSLITKVVKKESTNAYLVSGYDLKVSPLHLFYAKFEGSNPSWIESIALSKHENVMLLHNEYGWIKTKIEKTDEVIEILDIEVEGTNCWFSNGLLSHNTMFGDPTCLDPYTTKVKIRYKNVLVEEMTLFELSKKFLGLTDMVTPNIYDMSEHEIEILSVHDNNGDEVFMPLTHFIVKENVNEHYKLGELKGTGNHRVLYNNEWVSLKKHPDALLINEPINVVDVSVAETECYIANGQINHNTTPGGNAIPFHSSVRISLTGGSRIENKNGDVIGINVAATIKKNKVAPPHKKIAFQIHFGKGIFEHEELFDVLKEAGEKTINNKIISVSGEGSWKLFKVVDAASNTVLIEKKFNKSSFKEIINDNEYKNYISDLVDSVLVTHVSEDNNTDDVLDAQSAESDEIVDA